MEKVIEGLVGHLELVEGYLGPEAVEGSLFYLINITT
jgi:hypothetical protein